MDLSLAGMAASAGEIMMTRLFATSMTGLVTHQRTMMTFWAYMREIDYWKSLALDRSGPHVRGYRHKSFKA